MSERIVFSVVMGFWIAAIPCLPIMLLTMDDKPDFRIWLFFGTALSVLLFFTPAAKGEIK